MEIGDLVEARFKRWLGVDYGIVIKVDKEKIYVDWLNGRRFSLGHNKEELLKVEKK